MNGWLVAKRIREQTSRKKPLLIAVTGYGMDEDRLRSEEVGIDLHLVKPVDPEELENLLRRFRRIIMPGRSEDLSDRAARCFSHGIAVAPDNAT
jgi:CheY-like chemotaxis protein